MKKYAIVLLAFFTISCAFGQVDKRLKGIEKEFNKILKATKAPGFAVAIVEGDKVIYSKGFGYRDYENEIPMDANTLLAIGSSSKAFTCSILGQLRQEEKISFNDSPIKYIPELRFYNEDLNSRIIIQDLMSHQTGIPRHDFSWYLFPTYSKDSLIQRIQYHEPFTGLRQQWHYNNFMFLTLGVIAERITGKSWEDNIRERFFQPLGMKRSNVSIEELEKSSNAAVGYELKKDSIISKMDYYRIAGMSPAGSINSSVNEMSNWLITWINKGKFKGEQILPEYYVTEAMSSQAVINASLPRKDFPDLHLANYGYGWVISSYRGHYRVEHSGGIDGFSANVAFYPSDSIGIVVLTNQNGSAVPSFVRNTVADRMLGTKRTDWAQEFISRQKKNKEAKVESSSSKVSDTHPSHELQAYTGNYSHSGYGQFEITNQLDSMFANFKLKKYYLKHVHYDVFEPFEISKTGIDTTDTGPLRFNFITSDAGEIASVRMKIEGALDHPIEFDHEPNEIDVDLATLEKYTGEYDLSGTEIKIYIKNENTLYLFVAGQPEYEVIPTDKHIFTFKTLDGFKVEFKESDDKSINQLILRQPNGTFKATRK